MTTDTAGSSSPGGLQGGVLAGAPSALQLVVRQAVKRALERYEDAIYFASAAGKVEAINELLAELRLIATTFPATRYFSDRAEYERYTTLMEQAEERKS